LGPAALPSDLLSEGGPEEYDPPSLSVPWTVSLQGRTGSAEGASGSERPMSHVQFACAKCSASVSISVSFQTQLLTG
jgi:hypothetical protein